MSDEKKVPRYSFTFHVLEGEATIDPEFVQRDDGALCLASDVEKLEAALAEARERVDWVTDELVRSQHRRMVLAGQNARLRKALREECEASGQSQALIEQFFRDLGAGPSTDEIIEKLAPMEVDGYAAEVLYDYKQEESDD